jgi:hypothetical protein
MSTATVERERRTSERDSSPPRETAERLLQELEDYDFDPASVAEYPSEVRREIELGVVELRRLRRDPGDSRPSARALRARRIATAGTDPVARDQAVWYMTRQGAAGIGTLGESARRAPTDALKVSALLALTKVAHLDLDRAVAIFDDIVCDKASSVDVLEWALLLRRECVADSREDAFAAYGEPISERDYVHRPGRVFDLTLPLIFQGQAVTKIGPASVRLDISPHRFKRVFGHAMACIRSETFESHLVLEKLVPGIHADGSPHYELFPFSGRSEQLAPGAWHHNYWANIRRPFYSSGRVEHVPRGARVLSGVPMTFCRVAVTAVPDKYLAGGRPLPESVRGIFFGFGHVDPRIALRRRLALRAGDFQICSRKNPITGRPANTCFYGTFFGKLSDTDDRGRLVLNGRPTHCGPDGRLDYHGDATFAGDPIRPTDW